MHLAKIGFSFGRGPRVNSEVYQMVSPNETGCLRVVTDTENLFPVLIEERNYRLCLALLFLSPETSYVPPTRLSCRLSTIT